MVASTRNSERHTRSTRNANIPYESLQTPPKRRKANTTNKKKKQATRYGITRSTRDPNAPYQSLTTPPRRRRTPRENSEDLNIDQDIFDVLIENTPPALSPIASPIASPVPPQPPGSPELFPVSPARSPAPPQPPRSPARPPRSPARSPARPPRSPARSPARSPRSPARSPARSPRSPARSPRSPAVANHACTKRYVIYKQNREDCTPVIREVNQQKMIQHQGALTPLSQLRGRYRYSDNNFGH